MTLLDEGLAKLFQAVQSLGLPCMVGGGVATIFFGEPRTTLDIDIVVRITAGDVARVVKSFPDDRYYVPPAETMAREIARGSRGHFNIIDFASGLKADIYPAGNDPLAAFGFAHVVTRPMDGFELVLAPATYVIAMKLRYFMMSRQDKHLRDIRAILAISPEQVDAAEVERWARECGAMEIWRDCQARPGAE